jgi:hypothetical protein
VLLRIGDSQEQKSGLRAPSATIQKSGPPSQPCGSADGRWPVTELSVGVDLGAHAAGAHAGRQIIGKLLDGSIDHSHSLSPDPSVPDTRARH